MTLQLPCFLVPLAFHSELRKVSFSFLVGTDIALKPQGFLQSGFLSILVLALGESQRSGGKDYLWLHSLVSCVTRVQTAQSKPRKSSVTGISIGQETSREVRSG